jgi:hypothetical protein
MPPFFSHLCGLYFLNSRSGHESLFGSESLKKVHSQHDLQISQIVIFKIQSVPIFEAGSSI